MEENGLYKFQLTLDNCFIWNHGNKTCQVLWYLRINLLLCFDLDHRILKLSLVKIASRSHGCMWTKETWMCFCWMCFCWMTIFTDFLPWDENHKMILNESSLHYGGFRFLGSLFPIIFRAHYKAIAVLGIDSFGSSFWVFVIHLEDDYRCSCKETSDEKMVARTSTSRIIPLSKSLTTTIYKP